MTKVLFPGYRFGPNGECELFQTADEVPEGWTRIHPANRVEPAHPLDHDGNGRKGGSRTRKPKA